MCSEHTSSLITDPLSWIFFNQTEWPSEKVPSNKLHLKRTTLAAIIDKSTHIPKPPSTFEQFGWTGSAKDNLYVPETTFDPFSFSVYFISQCGPGNGSIHCLYLRTKGCGTRCSCVKDVPCNIGCKCTGAQDKCNHALLFETYSPLTSVGPWWWLSTALCHAVVNLTGL